MASQLESQKPNPDGLAPEPDSEPQVLPCATVGFFFLLFFRFFFFYPKLFSLRTGAPNLLTNNTQLGQRRPPGWSSEAPPALNARPPSAHKVHSTPRWISISSVFHESEKICVS